MVKKNIITLDLGATKCGAALVIAENKTIFSCQKTVFLKLHNFISLRELIAKIEQDLGCAFSQADAICIGAAGEYDGYQLQRAGGYPYVMNFAELAKQQHWPKFAVIHDYAPIVCATFTDYMNPQNVKQLTSGTINPFARRVALGVGTGLGLKDGVLFEDGNFWLGMNEMGHMGIPNPSLADPVNLKMHHEFLQFLQDKNHGTAITFETILSGQGLCRLYQFFYPGNPNLTPEEIGSKWEQGQANESKSAFAWYLGLFVGTVQLVFMPEGGIWMTGGVLIKHVDVCDQKEFFQGIEASPAYLNLRQKFPLGILHNPIHAFIGGAYYALKQLN